MITVEEGCYTGNAYLSLEQMKVNATYIYNYYLKKGWTAFAICGMLGNMQRESTINPGIWQNLDQYQNSQNGYGLVQWTPASNYLDWCFERSLNSKYMSSNLARIDYEFNNNLQWIPTDKYSMSFSAFSKSTLSPSVLAEVFLLNYERAGVSALAERQKNANYWYEYLTGNVSPDEPDEPDEPVNPGGTTSKKRKGYNFVLFGRRRRIYG